MPEVEFNTSPTPHPSKLKAYLRKRCKIPLFPLHTEKNSDLMAHLTIKTIQQLQFFPKNQ